VGGKVSYLFKVGTFYFFLNCPYKTKDYILFYFKGKEIGK
jgi:hypothetical protein